MSRRCLKKGGFSIHHDDWTFGQGRSIGQMVREARETGVMPDMTSIEGAFDDDSETGVDPYGNPRTDPMDLQASALEALYVMPDPAPADPAPSDPAPVDPAPAE